MALVGGQPGLTQLAGQVSSPVTWALVSWEIRVRSLSGGVWSSLAEGRGVKRLHLAS